MNTTTIAVLTLIWCLGAAQAAEISKAGDAIEVESYRCAVVSSRAIDCQNIGRICEAARDQEKKQTDHFLGCGLDKWKAEHPNEQCPDPWYHAPSECITTRMGGW